MKWMDDPELEVGELDGFLDLITTVSGLYRRGAFTGHIPHTSNGEATIAPFLLEFPTHNPLDPLV